MVVFLSLFLFLKPILCVRLTSSGTSLEWKYPPNRFDTAGSHLYSVIKPNAICLYCVFKERSVISVPQQKIIVSKQVSFFTN